MWRWPRGCLLDEAYLCGLLAHYSLLNLHVDTIADQRNLAVPAPVTRGMQVTLRVSRTCYALCSTSS